MCQTKCAPLFLLFSVVLAMLCGVHPTNVQDHTQSSLNFVPQQYQSMFVCISNRIMPKTISRFVGQNMHHMSDKMCTTLFLCVLGEWAVILGQNTVKHKCKTLIPNKQQVLNKMLLHTLSH